MAVPAERRYLDTAEFRAALDALSSTELIRLKKKAMYHAMGTGMEGDDLLHEAIVRTLSGDERHCPADVAVKVYLDGAMRSIADGAREKFEREAPAGSGHDEEDVVGRAADGRMSPADVATRRVDFWRGVEQLQALFGDDPEAQAVLIGDIEGWPPDEVKQMESMDDNAYAAARKRVLRTIEREFGGTKP